ncbi:energy transducer TonB [Terrimonas rubra]|uniref:Energy transducer TonB n=1 Tax=Terrimonas rubra TaxID=1035890 RepID=A0ABW6AAG1_9BACT
MVIRIVICFIFSFPILFLHAQEKVEVIISDTLLNPEKEIFRPEGQASWEDALRKKINPLVLIENGAPNGRYTVAIQYVYDKEGNLSDLKPITSQGYGMEQEVIRILKKGSTRWTPANQEEIKTKKTYGKFIVTFIKTNESYNVITTTPHTLFVGLDNPVTVTAHNVKPKRIRLTASENATIRRTGDFTYTVKVNSPNKAIIFTLKDRKKVLSTHTIKTALLPAPTK